MGQSTRRHFFEIKSAPIRWIYGPNVEAEIRFDRFAILGGFQKYHRDFFVNTDGKAFFDFDIELEDGEGEMSWIGLRYYFPKPNGVDFFIGARYRHKTLSFNRLNSFEDPNPPAYSYYKKADEVSDIGFLTFGVKFTRSVLVLEHYVGVGVIRKKSIEATYESYFGNPYTVSNYDEIEKNYLFLTVGLSLGLGL